MLLLRHAFRPKRLDVDFRQQELRSEDLIVCRARFSGGMFDEVRNLPSGRRRRWSKIRIVLAGHLFARTLRGGEILGPGDAVISRGWDDHRCRALDAHTDYLLVAWRHGTAAGDLPAQGGPLLLRGLGERGSPGACASALAHALDAPLPRPVVMSRLASVLESLVHLGLPVAVDAPIACSEGIQPVHHRFARAMETTFFPLAARPMAVDLGRALALGERQSLRLANEFLVRFFVTATTWRSYVRGMRLELGVFLSSNPDATTDAVSEALGFSSPTALCHAFQSGGLPSPLEVRRQLRDL
ncbi:MAG: hypothetical protein U0414_00165 [Polyangiaceae bacterium]